MLALTLRPDTVVTIGDNIKIHNNEDFNIRIAIDAPREIEIVRSDAKKKTAD